MRSLSASTMSFRMEGIMPVRSSFEAYRRPQLCCLQSSACISCISKGILPASLMASSPQFLSLGLLTSKLPSRRHTTTCRVSPLQAMVEAPHPNPRVASTGDGFITAAAAVLSRTMVTVAIVCEALVRAAGILGETLTTTRLPGNSKTKEEMELVAVLKGRLMCAAAPLFFAAVSQTGAVNTPLTVVASGMAKWLELYSGVLMVRVLLSWFPNIPWERQPLQAIRDMCDPYLNLFRNIVPPLFNALDLSPMLAFMVLGVLTSILNTTVQG